MVGVEWEGLDTTRQPAAGILGTQWQKSRTKRGNNGQKTKTVGEPSIRSNVMGRGKFLANVGKFKFALIPDNG